MAQGGAKRTAYSRIREVTLQAGDWQFLGVMGKECIGKSKIPFCIFKINRVDFLRHGRGTDLPFDSGLLKIAITDVSPDILRKINQYGIGQTDEVKILNPVVVRQNLRCSQGRG